MSRHRQKKMPSSQATNRATLAGASQAERPGFPIQFDEQPLESVRPDIPRDNPVPVGKGLPSPNIPETWEMRLGATELNTSKLHTGPETITEALRRLIVTNDPAYLFQRYGRLARITVDEIGLPNVVDLSQSALKGILARAAYWQAEVMVFGQARLKHISPPGYVVEDIGSHGDWPFLALRGISAIPVLRKDGSLHSRPGYDGVTKYWYEPAGILIDRTFTLPEVITEAARRRSVKVLNDWLSDFPFAGQAEKASALAFFLTLLARPVIDGNVPLGLIIATKSRTGKTLLVETILLSALGVLPALSSAPQEEAEWRKLLASCALHGKQYLVLDNLNGLLDSASLASVLTTGMISDRLLKTNDVLDMRADFVLVATGNQLQATTELLARSYRCLLDASMSRPQDRTGFHHTDILAYTRESRYEILEAGYTLLAGYLRAGRPHAATLPRKGGFEQWVDIIGGTLAYAGIPGFLENELELVASSDEGESEMERFLTALLQTFDHKPFKVAQVLEEATNKPNSPLSAALPTQLDEVRAMRSAFTSKAGLLLKKQKGVHYGSPDMWIQSVEDKHTKANSWQVLGGEHSPVLGEKLSADIQEILDERGADLNGD